MRSGYKENAIFSGNPNFEGRGYDFKFAEAKLCMDFRFNWKIILIRGSLWLWRVNFGPWMRCTAVLQPQLVLIIPAVVGSVSSGGIIGTKAVGRKYRFSPIYTSDSWPYSPSFTSFRHIALGRLQRLCLTAARAFLSPFCWNNSRFKARDSPLEQPSLVHFQVLWTWNNIHYYITLSVFHLVVVIFCNRTCLVVLNDLLYKVWNAAGLQFLTPLPLY